MQLTEVENFLKLKVFIKNSNSATQPPETQFLSISNHIPSKSFGLNFIPNQSDLFWFIPKSGSELIWTHPSQYEKSSQSCLMQID